MSDDFHIEIEPEASTPSYEEVVNHSRRAVLRARAVESVLDDLKVAVGGSFDGLVFQRPNGEWYRIVQKAVGFVAIPQKSVDR